MSTANFYTKNTGYTYACDIEDDFAYDDLIEELRFAFRSVAEDPRQKAIACFEEVYDTWESSGLRSYPGRVIAWVESERKSYRDFDAFLSAHIIVRSGYYAGANLDYDLRFLLDGEEISEELEEDDIDEVCLCSELPGTRRAYRLALARKWFDRACGPFTDAIEAIFTRYSTPLRLAARLSNGEAFYEKV